MSAVSTTPRSAWSARGWAIYLGWIVITLDGSALNLALPTISRQLEAPEGGIAWVVDAYTLPLAALLLLGGSLGDRWGAERLFRIGAVGFAASSLACGLSASFAMLIAFRAAQGIFAALLLPMVLALVGTSFDDARARTTAVNMLTAFGSAGVAVGPFLGGLLTDSLGWRTVFWLTAPIAVAAALLVGTGRPGATRRRERLDLVGQVVGTAGLVALVGGLIETGHDAGAVEARLLLLAGVALLAAFLLIEHRSPHPMMPLAVFRAPQFAGAVIGGFAFQFGAYGLQFFLAVHLQLAWGVSALTGGSLLVAFAVGSAVSSVLVNPFLLRRGSRRMVLVGTATAAAGALALLAVSGPEQWWLLVVAQFVVGVGTGIYSTALNNTASVSLGSGSAGLASGIYNTSRQVGQSVGIAVLGALAVASDARVGYLSAIGLVVLCTVVVAVAQRKGRDAERA